MSDQAELMAQHAREEVTDELQQRIKKLLAALQTIADGKDNLGWAPCAHIAENAIQEDKKHV